MPHPQNAKDLFPVRGPAFPAYLESTKTKAQMRRTPKLRLRLGMPLVPNVFRVIKNDYEAY
jgi:hypothetical protein